MFCNCSIITYIKFLGNLTIYLGNPTQYYYYYDEKVHMMDFLGHRKIYGDVMEIKMKNYFL